MSFQLLKLKYDKLLSNFACFALNGNLRHYSGVLNFVFVLTIFPAAVVTRRAFGSAVQLDPGFSHSTPRLPSGTFSA